MPYKTPKKNGRKGESNFALAVKLCYYIYKFQNPNKLITLKDFCDNFKEIVKHEHILEILHDDYGIEWTFFHDDNSICEPKYNTARNSWKPKYKWDEEYPIFKADRLMETDDSEMEKYFRQKAYFNSKDAEAMRTCYDKEEDYQTIEKETGKDMTYYRNKNQDTITNVENRWRKRLGLDTNNEVVKESQEIEITEDQVEWINHVSNYNQ